MKAPDVTLRLRRTLTCIVALAAVPASTFSSAAAQEGMPRYRFGGADIYGTDAITVEAFDHRFGDRARALLPAIQAQDGEAIDSLLQSIGGELRALDDIVWTDLGLIFQPSDTTAYITFDVVVRADSARRLAYAPKPTGQVPDPGGLLALWQAYEERFLGTMMQGASPAHATRENCPALHCLGGFGHDTALARYESAFVERTPDHTQVLLRVLREDADEVDRGAAAYLLAHAGMPDTVVAALVDAMRDPGALVRNNATRVLMMAVQFDADLGVPLGPVIRNIDAPTTTSRNKALYLLLGLARRPEHHQRIAREAGPALLRLLRLIQPNNHDPAWQVLKEISGESFGDRDYAAWERWLEGR